MKSLQQLLDELQARSDCYFYPPSRVPVVPSDLLLAPDLVAFYRRFGEARLFGDQRDPRCHLLPPDEFVQVGEAIEGEATATGIERSWYALAHVQDGNYIAIDLLPTRLGWCYDCFHETYREPGYCTVITRSFTELLQCFADAGNCAFWLKDSFHGYGDAYDRK